MPGDADLTALLQTRRPQLVAHIDRRLSTALRGKVEAEDIFQEVSISAFRAWPTLELQGRDPFGWLCQLAEERIIDAHRYHFEAQKRAAGREQSLNVKAGPEASRELIDLLAGSLSTPSMAVDRGERLTRLHAAIDELPDAVRSALRWRYGDGISTKEIAARTGKTDGAVRVMLTRALHKLQGALGEGV